jgi:integrase
MASLYQRGETWWVKYNKDGRVVRESTGESDRAAAERYKDWIGGGFTRRRNPTFGELAQDVVDDYKANKRRSLDMLECRLKKYVLPFFGEMRAERVTPAHVKQYIAKRQREGAANATINRELAIVKRAYALYKEAGANIGVPHVPTLKENNARRGFFEPHDFERVLEHMPEPLRPVLRFAYITGWRVQSEVLPLRWSQVDFQAGTVRLYDSKNGEPRVFPMMPELRQVLEAERDLSTGDYVWWRTGDLRLTAGDGPVKRFNKTWRKACKAAGLEGRIPHDFRRSAVRNLVKAGVPEKIAMELTGHKTRSVFDRYHITNESDLFDATEKLGVSLAQSRAQTGHSERETREKTAS